MKVAHIGNLANLGYIHCFFLRKAGIDAHLYINDTVPVLPIPYSFSENEEEPKWIHRYPRRNLALMAAKIIPLSFELAKYDIVHSWTCSLLPISELILALKNKKYFAYATGSDLREGAKRKNINGIRIRNHFKKAALVAHSFDNLTLEVASRLGLKNCSLLKIPVGETSSKQYNIDSDRKTVFFMPSRLHFTKQTKHEVCLKNNTLFLSAFSSYINKGGNAQLILLRRGTDYEKTVHLLKQLKLTEHVLWKDEMSPAELSNFFYYCDVVVDQFNPLSSPLPGGAIAIEAMATGTPVLLGRDLAYNKRVYGTAAPVLACSDENEILKEIYLCENKKYVRDAGIACKEWIQKHHGWEIVTNDLIHNYSLHI